MTDLAVMTTQELLGALFLGASAMMAVGFILGYLVRDFQGFIDLDMRRRMREVRDRALANQRR